MAKASFVKNQKIKISGEIYVLLHQITDSEWQIQHTLTGKVETKTNMHLLQLYTEGRLIFLVDQSISLDKKAEVNLQSFDLIDPNLREQAKIRLAYVREVKKQGLTQLTKESLTPLIIDLHARISKPQNPPSWSTVYRWHRAYYESGEDIKALVPKHHLKGNTQRRFDTEVINCVKKAIDNIYLTLERPTVQDTLDFAIELVRRENTLRLDDDKLSMPTYALVKKEITSIPDYEKDLARFGPQVAQVKYRSALGINTANKPLEKAEIDHTSLDIMVVDDSSMLPLGRPTLTLCVDTMSRCVLGFYIGFESPNFSTVSQCLKQSILPKPDLEDKYPNVKNSWDCYGVMETLVVDNGMEFHSSNLEALCLSFGINVQYSPRKQAWFKPFVERAIQTMNRGVAHGNPGTTFKNILDKGDYNAVKQATISLSTLKEIIHIWIIDVYHQKQHRTLRQKPIQVWQDNINSASICLPTDMHELDSLTGSVAERRLDHAGVTLHNLSYNSKELELIRRECGAVLQKVTVRYNESDLGYVYVVHPQTHKVIKVAALNADYASGLSLWQHKVCRKFAKKHFSRSDIEAVAQAKSKIKEIIQNDVFKKRSVTRSKAARFMCDVKETKAEKPLADVNTSLSIGSGNSTYTRKKMDVKIQDKKRLYNYE